MTRILSELLQASEPSFRIGLQRLEQANGSPNHDIRLTAEVVRSTKVKIMQLGLDPHDTTGEELYQTLQARVKADDVLLERVLRTRAAMHVSAEADLMAGMVHALSQVPQTKQCFALKASVLKTLLKKQPPKRAMKQLGYRSLDSMLKHEPLANVLAASYLLESQTWRHNYSNQYKRLRSNDFETRAVVICSPSDARWQRLASEAVDQLRHTVISFRELGTIILLPLPKTKPAASVIATLAVAIHELNEIQACSTFLKISQVRPDFGVQIQTAVRSEPQLQARLLDQPVPWHMMQRFYTQLNKSVHGQLFEPYLQLEDFSWHAVEDVLTRIAPHLDFWQQTAHLGLLDKGRVVSLNILDNARNCCNQLAYAERQAKVAQQALLAELSLRYLKHETLASAILGELQPQLAMEPALI